MPARQPGNPGFGSPGIKSPANSRRTQKVSHSARARIKAQLEANVNVTLCPSIRCGKSNRYGWHCLTAARHRINYAGIWSECPGISELLRGIAGPRACARHTRVKGANAGVTSRGHRSIILRQLFRPLCPGRIFKRGRLYMGKTWTLVK